jgi:hypothetical protein
MNTPKRERWIFHVAPQVERSGRSLRRKIDPYAVLAAAISIDLALSGVDKAGCDVLLPGCNICAQPDHKSVILQVWCSSSLILTLAVADRGSLAAAKLWRSIGPRDSAPPVRPWALTWYESGYDNIEIAARDRCPPAELALAWAWLERRVRGSATLPGDSNGPIEAEE